MKNEACECKFSNCTSQSIVLTPLNQTRLWGSKRQGCIFLANRLYYRTSPNLRYILQVINKFESSEKILNLKKINYTNNAI